MAYTRKDQDGFVSPHEMPSEYDYTRANGTNPTRIWEGYYDDVKSMYDSLIAEGPASMSLHRIGESPVYRLTATYAVDPIVPPNDPETNPPINTYELEDNMIQQPTSQSLVLWTKIGGEGTSVLVMDVYERWKAKKISYEVARDEIEVIASVEPDRTNALTWFDQMVNGVESFYNFHTVFRRNVTVVHPSQMTAAYTGIKQIWTSGQIIVFEGLAAVADKMFFVIPTGLQWLKIPPRVLAQTNQRTQISYEYWGVDSISTLYYEVYGGPSV